MAYSSYLNAEGKKRWRVYVNLRSKIDPTIRVQKEARNIESEGKADRKEKEFHQECLREIIKREGSQPTFKEIVDKWEKYRRNCGDIQENTIDDYLSAVKMWCDNLLSKPASEINKGDVRKTINGLIENGKSNSFQNKVLNGIKRIYTWGKEEGLIKGGLENITSGIKVSKVEEKIPEILTASEIEKLLLEAKLENSKWYSIWLVALLTGMRSGELYALTWDDLDFGNETIKVSKSFNKKLRIIKSTKGAYFRVVPMNKALKDFLIELKSKSKTEHILPRNREWSMGLQAQELRKYCISIGITSVKFHALRSCFATHLLNYNVPLTTVMKVCGWKELSTVQRYVRLSGINERGATSCLDKLVPCADIENILKFR